MLVDVTIARIRDGGEASSARPGGAPCERLEEAMLRAAAVARSSRRCAEEEGFHVLRGPGLRARGRLWLSGLVCLAD
eukprot:15861830-Heterocapsa_arctica.AAC.1